MKGADLKTPFTGCLGPPRDLWDTLGAWLPSRVFMEKYEWVCLWGAPADFLVTVSNDRQFYIFLDLVEYS